MKKIQNTEELLEALRCCADVLRVIATAQSNDGTIYIGNSYFNIGGNGYDAVEKAQEALDKYQRV
jgi:hypothetical protein